MSVVVAAIGAVLAVLGLVGAIAPGATKALARLTRRPGGVYVAATLRLVTGVLLIFAAPFCRPENYSQEVVRALGVVTVAAAVTFLLIGQRLYAGFIDWWLRSPAWFIRLWSLVAALVGGYLIYASNAL